MYRYLFLLLTLFYFSATAEIYKWVDENGEVHFSDTEVDGAEQVELRRSNTLPPTKTDSSSTSRKDKPAFSYTSIAIVKPEMNTTFRDNTGNVDVAIELSPSLRSGDSITLVMDGEDLLKNQKQTAFALKNIDRGSHVLRATVIGKDGVAAISSKSVLFHLHRAVTKKKVSTSKNKP